MLPVPFTIHSFPARSIDAIAFRSFPGASPSPFFGNTLTLSNVIIQLSTTSRGDEGPGVLSPTFASNIGADVTTVYSGPLTITTTVPGTFDYLVTFQTPFIYNPALGNLLLDVLVPVSATASGPGFGFLTFDNANTLNDGVFSIVSISDGGATTGFAGTDGAIARFFSSQVGGPVSVPEPASFMMLAFGAAMLGLVARRGGATLRA